MRICIVTTAFPRWPGDDRGIFILEAARAIRSQGLQVRVIAIHSPGSKTHETMDSIEVIRPRYLWPQRLEVLQREGGGLPIMWRKSRWARFAVLPFLLAHTLTVMRYARGCDIIHANWTLSAIAAWLGKFYHRRPIVVTVHGSDIFQAAQMPFTRRMTKFVLGRADRIIAVSEALAKTVFELRPHLQRADVIPDGVDTSRLRPPEVEREALILFVGSLIQRKGLKYLIEAMPHVLKRKPEFRLVIVGEGPQADELIRLTNSLHLSANVTFVGAVAPAQVVHWMQRTKLFVLPSLEEGLGVVLLEALACGTPCIATRVGGIPSVISSDVGMLVPPADSSALADAILFILDDLEFWNRASRNARLRAVDRYSWDKIGIQLVAVYQAVLNYSANFKP